MVSPKSQRPSRRWAIGVIDFDETQGRIDQASVKWGPEFAGGADPPSWAPDSSHVVYAASHSPSEWLVVTGTEPGPSHTDAITNYVVAFRSDGTAAFKAKDAGRWFIVVGGERRPSFDDVSVPYLRPPTGRWSTQRRRATSTSSWGDRRERNCRTRRRARCRASTASA